MGKKLIVWLAAGLILFATAGTLAAHLAESVLKSDMSDGLQVVIARKSLMETFKGHVVAIHKKLGQGNVGEVSLNGETIAAIATVLPPLFRETHKAVYPIKGSDTFFKGADPLPFQKAAERLRAAAAEVKKAAEAKDAGAVKGAMGKVGASCGGCHSAYRGKY